MRRPLVQDGEGRTLGLPSEMCPMNLGPLASICGRYSPKIEERWCRGAPPPPWRGLQGHTQLGAVTVTSKEAAGRGRDDLSAFCR